MLGWFHSEKREQRRKIGLHRKHLAPRSHRFLRNYLNAGEKRKARLLPCVGPAYKGLPSGICPVFSRVTDREIAQAAADAALTKVLERLRVKNTSGAEDFVTDAYATIGIAFHRSAGVYSSDPAMQRLGTAAVHLLTIATSFSERQSAQGDQPIVSQWTVNGEYQ